MVGKGDAHGLAQLGTTYSLADAERDPDSICQAIAAGRVRVVTTPLTWPTAVRTMVSIVAPSFGLGPRSPQPARAAV